jgi:hypothetical protein
MNRFAVCAILAGLPACGAAHALENENLLVALPKGYKVGYQNSANKQVGRDSFYLVQKAFKFEPSAEQGRIWGGFLDSARVCDTRLPDRPCNLGG